MIRDYLQRTNLLVEDRKLHWTPSPRLSYMVIRTKYDKSKETLSGNADLIDTFQGPYSNMKTTLADFTKIEKLKRIQEKEKEMDQSLKESMIYLRGDEEDPEAELRNGKKRMKKKSKKNEETFEEGISVESGSIGVERLKRRRKGRKRRPKQVEVIEEDESYSSRYDHHDENQDPNSSVKKTRKRRLKKSKRKGTPEKRESHNEKSRTKKISSASGHSKSKFSRDNSPGYGTSRFGVSKSPEAYSPEKEERKKRRSKKRKTFEVVEEEESSDASPDKKNST